MRAHVAVVIVLAGLTAGCAARYVAQPPAIENLSGFVQSYGLRWVEGECQAVFGFKNGRTARFDADDAICRDGDTYMTAAASVSTSAPAPRPTAPTSPAPAPPASDAKDPPK